MIVGGVSRAVVRTDLVQGSEHHVRSGPVTGALKFAVYIQTVLSGLCVTYPCKTVPLIVT